MDVIMKKKGKNMQQSVSFDENTSVQTFSNLVHPGMSPKEIVKAVRSLEGVIFTSTGSLITRIGIESTIL